jgi:hypothetical protein
MEPSATTGEQGEIKNKGRVDTGQIMGQTTPEKTHPTLETFEGRGEGWPEDKK